MIKQYCCKYITEKRYTNNKQDATHAKTARQISLPRIRVIRIRVFSPPLLPPVHAPGPITLLLAAVAGGLAALRHARAHALVVRVGPGPLRGFGFRVPMYSPIIPYLVEGNQSGREQVTPHLLVGELARVTRQFGERAPPVTVEPGPVLLDRYRPARVYYSPSHQVREYVPVNQRSVEERPDPLLYLVLVLLVPEVDDYLDPALLYLLHRVYHYHVVEVLGLEGGLYVDVPVVLRPDYRYVVVTYVLEPVERPVLGS